MRFLTFRHAGSVACCLAVLGSGGVLLGLACAAEEDRLEAARQAVPSAVERGDRAEALEALAPLRGIVPSTPAALLETASLFESAGELPQSVWLLEAGAERFPERADVQLALARAALRVSNPALARIVSGRISEAAVEYAEALELRAQAELALGDLEAALRLLEDAEARFPDRAQTRLLRIATLTHERRHAEAKTAIEAALAELPEDATRDAARRRLELGRVQVLMSIGENAEAEAWLRDRVADEPADLQAWELLVQLLSQSGRLAEATALVTAAASPDEAPLYAISARLHAAQGETEKAEAALRAYAEGMGSAAAVVPLVRFLVSQQELEQAMAALEEAIGAAPREPLLRMLQTEVAIERGDLAGARAARDQYAAAEGSSEDQSTYLEARILLAEGQAEAAARLLTELAPRLDVAATHYWLGLALKAQGDFEGATRRFGLAAARDRQEVAPYFAVLEIVAQRGNAAELANLGSLLVQRAPGVASSWVAAGQGLLLLGRHDEAATLLQEAHRRIPEDAQIHGMLARALAKSGKVGEGVAAGEAAVSAHPEDPGVVAGYALLLAEAGDLDASVTVLGNARERFPDAAPVEAADAAVAYLAGEVARGDAATERALALAPEDLTPLRKRCEFRTATGVWRGAITDCTRYLGQSPNDAGAHFMLAVAQTGAGEEDAAIASFREAAKLDATDFRAPNNLADLLAKRNDLDGALEAAQEAYRLSDEHPYVADTLGALYLKKGRVERAISFLEEARQGAPDLPDATLHLAEAYLAADRDQEAQALLDELRSAHPELAPRIDEVARAID